MAYQYIVTHVPTGQLVGFARSPRSAEELIEQHQGDFEKNDPEVARGNYNVTFDGDDQEGLE